VPYCATAPSPLDVGTTAVGAVRGAALTVTNSGTGPLTISAAGTDDTQFWAGRQSLVVAAGQSDTLGVYYKPTAAGYDSATLTVIGDDPYGPHTVKVKGRGVPVVGVEGGTPTAFACWQNRPNPFTGRTAIRYALPVAAKVSLEVFNLEGQRVAVLVAEEQGPGEHSVSFGPGVRGVHAGLPSGIYFYRFRAGSYTATHRMVMMK
jgi:ASPM-SPD-2-Hydin domain-containing protein